MNALSAGSTTWHMFKAYLCRSAYSASLLGSHRPWHNRFCMHLIAHKIQAAHQKKERIELRMQCLRSLLADAEVSEKLALSMLERNAAAVEFDWQSRSDALFNQALTQATDRLRPAKRELEDLERRLAGWQMRCERYGLQLAILQRVAKARSAAT